jgi:hypothetical protein
MFGLRENQGLGKESSLFGHLPEGTSKRDLIAHTLFFT